jgi:peptidoglycan/LPS O-acetylase OafA/YrhL
MYLSGGSCILDCMNSGEVWRLGHRPGLDGLRGVAVLMVIAYHAWGVESSGAGVVGVTVFFVLSGFLITALLLAEGAEGGVSFGGFYARRARRLLPALVVFLIAMTAVQVATNAAGFVSLDTLPGVALYIGNWLPAAGRPLYALTHVWSLAVEEQFYLVWPLALVAAARWRGDRGVAWVVTCGILVSVGLRIAFVAAGHDYRAYYGTDTAASALLVGALVAVLVRRGVRVTPLAALVALPALVVLATLSHDRFLVAPLASTGLTAVVVSSVASVDRLPALEPRWLTAIGRRSYGLYLWHFPLVWYVAPRMNLPQPAAVAAMLALSWVLTALSWRYVERPFLRQKGGVTPHDLRLRKVAVAA